MKKRNEIVILRFVLGLFFIVLGVIGVIPRLQESVFSLNDNLGLEIFFGLIELLCGLIFIAGLFSFMRRRVVSITSLVVLAFWLLRILLSKFVWGLSISNHGLLFRPTFSAWLLVLCAELVIGAAIYTIYRNYE
ncbi:MAG: hypothetical protein JXA20_17010 [Spirochaetes bacterium]|nr:hypothetical protein [Spirochaetota bacterium]